ncbi:hypothetical protein [Vibrio sp. TRT 17S01]|uniref:hypothetical protein n=1 Tax=Vibrio sp. TRT 17S01 TaxID=3418505 RepID=UPI003CF4A638
MPKKLWALTFAVGLMLFGSSAHAVDWSVSGFGTLGYTYENEADLGYRRDITRSADIEDNGIFNNDSNVGVQLDLTFDHHWSITSQWLLDNSIDYDLDEMTELAFVRYEPNENWDFRVGRVGVSAYAAADSRHIDYAHLWVRPPQELYGGIVFNSLDGVGFTYYSNNANLNWSASAEYGRITQMGEVPELQEKYRAKLKDVLSLSFEVEQDKWRWQLSYAHVGSLSVNNGPSLQSLQNQIAQVANSNIPLLSEDAASLYDALVLDDEEVTYLQAAVTYFDSEWTAQSELFRITTDKNSIPQGYGGYVLLGKAFERLTPYVMYGAFHVDQAPYQKALDWSLFNPALVPLQEGAIAGINSVRIEQSTYSLGLRWDVASQVAVKAQLDYVEIEPFGYGLWATPASRQGGERDALVLTLNMNFIF